MERSHFLFMCEAEGVDSVVNTRTARINAVIKDIKNYPTATMDGNTFKQILMRHSLTYVTQDEMRKISNAIK